VTSCSVFHHTCIPVKCFDQEGRGRRHARFRPMHALSLSSVAVLTDTVRRLGVLALNLPFPPPLHSPPFSHSCVCYSSLGNRYAACLATGPPFLLAEREGLMRGAGRDKEPNVCFSNLDHGTGSSVGILCGAVLSACRSTSRSEIQGEQMLVVMSRGNIMKSWLIHKSRTPNKITPQCFQIKTIFML